MAGKSIIAFGIVSFLSSIVFAIVADAFVLDLGSFILMYLGGEIIRGMRKATKWALGIMIYYSAFYIFTGFMLATGNAGSLNIMGKSIQSFNPGVVAFILFIYGAWAITNVVLSKQALAETTYKNQFRTTTILQTLRLFSKNATIRPLPRMRPMPNPHTKRLEQDESTRRFTETVLLTTLINFRKNQAVTLRSP